MMDVHPVPVPAALPPPADGGPGSPGRAASLAEGRHKDMVVLQVRAERTSWLDVEDAGGKRLFSGTLKAGKTSTWKAKDKMRVTFGDGGAFSLKVNGKNLGAPGTPGQIINRSYEAPAAKKR